MKINEINKNPEVRSVQNIQNTAPEKIWEHPRN